VHRSFPVWPVSGGAVMVSEGLRMKDARFSLLYRHVESFFLDRLPESLHYHCSEHSLVDVLGAVRWLAQAQGLDAEQCELLEVAAVLHDIGYLRRYDNNEVIAARYAERWLPYFGYTPQEALCVAELIRATAMPQQPQTLLQQILCDADLDGLGCATYWQQAIRLRWELEAQGRYYTWQHWLEYHHTFLKKHRYFTPAAKMMRDVGKRENLRFIETKINEFRYFSLF